MLRGFGLLFELIKYHIAIFSTKLNQDGANATLRSEKLKMCLVTLF